MGNSRALSETETSLLLDTYMYLNYDKAEEGEPLKEILKDLSEKSEYHSKRGKYHREYEILKQAVAINPAMGELKISSQSSALGFDSGTKACVFQENNTGTVYVVYRGTGDGEWMDNGLGLTTDATTQQKRALEYFDKAMSRGGFTEDNRIIVTGHSKGGNKAQFVTMESIHGNLIDKCYSVDGQGFSDEAVEKWQTRYGAADYTARTAKLYGIHGENDFINGLGRNIIPADHIRYLQTPVEDNNVAGFHDIKYMFAAQDSDGRLIFNGVSNQLTSGPKEWGDFAKKLSAEIMALPPEERAGCAAAMMQLMELGGKKKSGLNGEQVTLSDWKNFFQSGVPTIITTFLYSGEGVRLLGSFGRQGNGGSSYAVKPDCLTAQAGTLTEMANQVKRIAAETETVLGQLRVSMKTDWFFSLGVGGKIKKEQEKLEKEAEQLLKLAGGLERAAGLYLLCEQNVLRV